MEKIQFYSYRDLANLFNVSVQTVRNWRWKGDFQIAGYRRLKGWGKKEAVVTEDEVKRLIFRKLVNPTLPFH